jgi:hypothetical protein
MFSDKATFHAKANPMATTIYKYITGLLCEELHGLEQ